MRKRDVRKGGRGRVESSRIGSCTWYVSDKVKGSRTKDTGVLCTGHGDHLLSPFPILLVGQRVAALAVEHWDWVVHLFAA